MATISPDHLVRRISAAGRSHRDDRSHRRAVVDVVRATIGFDVHVFLLTDPATEVGHAPLADVPSLDELPRLIAAKYRTPTNRWTSLPATAVTLLDATGGDPGRSELWTDVLAAHGVVDVASLVFRDRFGCWGWLDLWRDAPFTHDEVAALGATVTPLTAALRRHVASSFVAPPPPSVPAGPAVLVLGRDLTLRARTAEAEGYLRALLPTEADRRPIPAAAYNVAAQLLAVEAGVDGHPASARSVLADGTCLSIRAARMDEDGPGGDGDVAVTVEHAGPTDRRTLLARAAGLSAREAELLGLLADGADTRAVATAMVVAESTVQDHLKSIFAKTGVRSRRDLVARFSGA